MTSLDKIPLYEEGKPHQPIYGPSFLDELKATWGEEWGWKSPFGRIKKVLVCAPGEEQYADVIKTDKQLFNLPAGETDPEKMKAQHQTLVDLFVKEGIEVIFLNDLGPFVGTYGIPLRSCWATRESIMVRGGAIICRPPPAYKKGLEYFQAKKLMELGCPILHTIHGDGYYEASSMCWIDEKSVILAAGMRANDEGRRQVEYILRGLGVEDIHHAELPGYLNNRKAQMGGSSGMFHLDLTFTMAYEKIGLIWPGGVGYNTIQWLLGKGVDLIEVPDDELLLCAANCLPIEPKKVIAPAIGLSVTDELRKRGIEVLELDLTEFAKGGGGVTCMTLPLIREGVDP
jgi:N-dimethylarginine dimethylaminohydrolase